MWVICGGSGDLTFGAEDFEGWSVGNATAVEHADAYCEKGDEDEYGNDGGVGKGEGDVEDE